jgi:hypothetical protein
MRLFGLIWWSALLSVTVSACVYDAQERCGPHQTEIDKDRCICEMGYVPGTAGCIPCGDHEQASNGACVCEKDYARPADGAACEPIPAALGAACDTETPCAAGPYSLCHTTDDAAGYCTNACRAADDCDGGYKCHDEGADSYCRRPPVGYGDSCQSDDDCAGGEATYCESLQSKLCLVPCAAGHTDVCFEGEVCCDFVVVEPVCVPSNACSEKHGTPLQ